MTDWVKSPDAAASAPFWTPEFLLPKRVDGLATLFMVHPLRLTEAVQGVKATAAAVTSPYSSMATATSP